MPRSTAKPIEPTAARSADRSGERAWIHALAVEEFRHPTSGELVPRGSVVALSAAEYEPLRRGGIAILTMEGLRHMKKVKALKITSEPSTGNSIFEGQVLHVTDDDAKALVAAGDVRDAHEDEAITRDVGALRSQMAAPKSE